MLCTQMRGLTTDEEDLCPEKRGGTDKRSQGSPRGRCDGRPCDDSRGSKAQPQRPQVRREQSRNDRQVLQEDETYRLMF